MNQEKFNVIVNMFKQAKDKHEQPLNMHDFLIQRKDQCYVHHFNEDPSPSDIRSISKTIMTLVLGVAIKLSEEEKYPKISEETYIYPIIKNAITQENKANEVALKKIKIKHLLTHTVGFDDVLLMRGDIANLDPFEYLNYVVNYPIVHESGEHYLYSNAGFYLLSVVLQEFLQEDLLVFVKRELFDPLGVKDFTWEKYGDYIAGATRLWLLPEDLLKVGELLLQNGKANGEELVTRSWIKKMLTPRHYTDNVDTPGATFRRYAYGYGIWLAKDGFYFGHGTDGQTLTIIPDKETVIITLAEQPDMKPIEKIINEVIENEKNTTSLEAFFEFSYRYDKVGFSFNQDGKKELPFKYEINVTIMFTWNNDRNTYEVESYASSPTVDYVEVPHDEELKKDVFRDLRKKGIKLDYIPDFQEWGL